MKNKFQIFGSLLTIVAFLFLAFGSDDESSSVDLNASVSFTGTQFVITNNDEFDYTNAKLEVNNNFVLKGQSIKAGETYTVGMMQFADGDGNRFDMMKKPQSFSIWCDLRDGNKGFYYAEW